MKKTLLLAILFGLVGCGTDNSTKVPNNKKYIIQNTERIELLEVSDALQNLRLDVLEGALADLEGRVAVNEDAIDANESDIADLFDFIDGLDDELNDLKNELRRQIRKLKRADRRTRRLIRSEVRYLSYKLSREIRSRQLADSNLQNQIDSLENDLNRFQARQRMANMFLDRAIMMVNIRVTQLQSRVSRDINRINRKIRAIETDISEINSEIVSIQNSLTQMQSDIESLESSVVSVVHPCGEENGEEVLLQTQDGLVAYFQEMRNESISFNDRITIPSYSISGHYDKYCVDTSYFSGRCNDYDYRYHRGQTIPSRTYNIGDTATVKVLKKAYLDLLNDGNYRTTDGFSCYFSIQDGELVEQEND